MIDKLIDKYRETIRASKEIVEEQRQQRFPAEITIRSEITRFCVYETAIKDLEELKEKINNLDITSINAPSIVITQILKNEIIGVDTDDKRIRNMERC